MTPTIHGARLLVIHGGKPIREGVVLYVCSDDPTRCVVRWSGMPHRAAKVQVCRVSDCLGWVWV